MVKQSKRGTESEQQKKRKNKGMGQINGVGGAEGALICIHLLIWNTDWKSLKSLEK